MQTPSLSAPDSELKRAWRALVDQIRDGEAPLGERLYLLGAGPVPVAGAAGGALTLDADGGVILVVGLEEASAEAAAQVAQQLDGISKLPGSKLREAGVDPALGGGLARRHAGYFELRGATAELNSSQSCIVVLGEDASEDGRTALETELGEALSGVFVATASGVRPVEAETPDEPAPPVDEAEETAPETEAPDVEGPAEIEVALDEAPAVVVEEEPAAAEAEGEPAPDLVAPYLEDESTTVIVEESDAVAEKTGIAAWPIGNWIGLTMVLLGVVLVVVGIMSLRDRDRAPAQEETNPEIRTVATDVVQDATHSRWIGQQRVVTLSDGTMVFVYPTEGSINLVKDGATGGDTWEEPFVLDGFAPKTLSVDVDSKDRLHVVYSDAASVHYVRLKNKPAGWKPSRVIELDDDTTSLVVDIAWDEKNQTAHAVWVQQSDDGEAPAWAALTSEGGIHVTDEGLLADPATDLGVLASAAADSRGSLLITYRRGDQVVGWASRYTSGRQSDGTWLFEEEDEVPIDAGVGASDILYDRQKTAHLVLRDSTNYALTYFTKTEDGPWSEGEVAHTGPNVDALELPVLSYNAAENNLYLFFQTQEFDPAGEVSYSVRALDSPGWQGPFDITTAADAPEGVLYPVAPDRVEVQSIVFWTKTADTYEVGAAPVVAP
ncbi:MAG: hypothetical protein M3271_06175 [Actinomycetota bacterium]|nr:hypothetical protein [Actinomycetota bacterium]